MYIQAYTNFIRERWPYRLLKAEITSISTYSQPYIHKNSSYRPIPIQAPHTLQILLVKLTFLPQKHILNLPNRRRIEGGCWSSEGRQPGERGPNLEGSNILNLIRRVPFR